MDEFTNALAEFETAFSADLRSDIASVPKDSDVYAYAIEVRDDPSSLYLDSKIATVSGFRSEMSSMTDLAWWETLLFTCGDRYSDPHWEYSKGKTFEASNECLASIQQQFCSTDDEVTLDRRLDQLYEVVLRRMKSLRAESALPSNVLLLIDVTYGEHRITRRSFNELNSLRLRARLWPMYNLHPYLYCPIALTTNLSSRLFRRSSSG